jgi:hypothetical protein
MIFYFVVALVQAQLFYILKRKHLELMTQTMSQFHGTKDCLHCSGFPRAVDNFPGNQEI